MPDHQLPVQHHAGRLRWIKGLEARLEDLGAKPRAIFCHMGGSPDPGPRPGPKVFKELFGRLVAETQGVGFHYRAKQPSLLKLIAQIVHIRPGLSQALGQKPACLLEPQLVKGLPQLLKARGAKAGKKIDPAIAKHLINLRKPVFVEAMGLP